MTWNPTNVYNSFNLVDFAGGVILYQRVRVSGVVRVGGTSMEVDGEIGVVGVHH
jgi:uncharacterized protein GlcG (DUF336 family)